MGASFIIGVEGDPVRMKMAKQMGADIVLDPKQVNVVEEVKRLTSGGTDVAIEALGIQVTFENCLRCLRPGGTLSSLGVYSGKLQVPYDAFAAGIGDYKIVTTLCPGGKERMRRLMSIVLTRRFDPTPLLTHKFSLDQIVEACKPFRIASRRRVESRDPAIKHWSSLMRSKTNHAHFVPHLGSRHPGHGWPQRSHRQPCVSVLESGSFSAVIGTCRASRAGGLTGFPRAQH